MKKLAIIGAGELGRQIAHFAMSDNQFNVVGFFDDTVCKNEKIVGISVLGSLKDIEECYELNMFDELLIGIGYKHMGFRKEVFNRFFKKIPFGKLIHSTVLLDKTASVAEGVIVYPGCLIDANVEIKNNVLINLKTMIAHNTILHEHSFISANVSVAGLCDIGELNILGIGSVIIDHVKTVPFVELGAGAVVIKNISEQGLYVGVPAKFIR